jgi:hypothetical protein
MNLLNALRSHSFTKLFIILAVFIGMYQEGLSAQNAAAEKQAKEKAITDRIAFEKDRAQKQIAQKEEDGRKAALREKEQSHRQIPSLHQQQPLQQQSPSQTQAYQNSVLQDGKAFASSLLGNVTGAAKSTNPQMVPRFQTDKPKEASLDNGSIGDAALAESRSNQASQHLYGQAKDRQSFKVDPTTDPLLLEANQAIAAPQKTLGDTRVKEEIEEVKGELGEEDGFEELKTCEESGEEYQQSCSKHLEIVLKVIPEQGYTVPKSCIGHWKSRVRGTKYWCAGCRGGNYVRTQAKKVETLKEEWVDGCAVLEDLTEKGLCRYVSASRSPKNETRIIQGEPITRDHFEEHYTYACFKASPQSCAGLQEQGCFQVKSHCKEIFGNQCVLWEQTYSCPSGKRSAKRYRASTTDSRSLFQTSLFCLTGDCADTSYKANNELLNVMSHLYALREAQNDLRNFKIIFKGNPRWCTRNCVDFRDCCGSGNGWGVALHLSSCDAQEIELRTLRDKNLCIQVGTYCAEKLLGVCIRKKTGFCCYGTKMARLIQQQGRAQLGLNFGSPECPECTGLSPEQLSQLDFSKINFSEIFEDIKNQTVAKGQGQSLAQVSTERLQNNMTLLTKPPLNAKSTKELQKLKEKGL